MTAAFSLMSKELPLIMGILNVTPDSFADGGRHVDTASAVAHGLRLMDQGCDILDIGGESSRPGALPVPVDEERNRVVPVVAALRDEAAKRGVLISVDTRNALTMQAAADAGAGMINDISALTHDEASVVVAAKLRLPIVLMHMQGNPEDMQNSPHYKNVVLDVFEYLANRIKACEDAGIERSLLVADPGIGFGKTAAHNAVLLHYIATFHKLGVPILIGASRKSFIKIITGAETAEERLPASLAVAIFAAQQGVQILRVHDVAETKQALSLWRALQQATV